MSRRRTGGVKMGFCDRYPMICLLIGIAILTFVALFGLMVASSGNYPALDPATYQIVPLLALHRERA